MKKIYENGFNKITTGKIRELSDIILCILKWIELAHKRVGIINLPGKRA